MTVDELAEKYRFREAVVDALREDLVGPGGGDDEEIGEAPLNRYIVGALWPRPQTEESAAGTAQAAAAEPTGAQADADSDEGSPVAEARMRFPSSMGMTFSVRASANAITITPSAARYEQHVDAKDAAAGNWKRIPLQVSEISKGLKTPGVTREPVAPGLEFYCLIRPERDGIVTVTVALNNTDVAAKGELRDGLAWFQVGIEVATQRPDIVDRQAPKNLGHDQDLDSAALMYRHAYAFATGHGCSADWNHGNVVDGAVDRVSTTFIPSYEVHRARPGTLRDVDLRMSTLADGSIESIAVSLRGLTAAYRDWIDTLEGDVGSGAARVDGDELKSVAAAHIEEMRAAATRIEAGISLLERDPDALRAFRLANRAMQLQRARQDWIRGGAKDGELTDGSHAAWRPFQIAYVLLNLPGITDPRHADRDVADLLWFPTGGGKTEAYLGLVAFVILLRRIRDSSTIGVAVIMRYTLRLLTIQQFERASMLMCSLETVRKDNGDLGARPFSIGLWVGAGATPNSLAEARSSLRKLAGGPITEKNPVQLTQCPWCGTFMNYENYKVVTRPEAYLRIACGTPTCDFRNGLPVHVVDEDVYRERPELILGTVDKFAMMAWNENVGKLFARDKGLPPELIIQDELHLISGPLGSMVGLYETAVDAACEIPSLTEEFGRARPKVIASTATIRRADKQIRSVFDRSTALFPPPGIDPDRSFFAEPSTRDELGTREYVGVMASGSSHATLLVRVYAALLQAAQDIEGDDETRDPYWTLLGYFNSLRVLGSANLQVEGDVRERLGVVAGRSGKPRRDIKTINELTSRVSSAEIPEHLKSLENRVGGRHRPDDVVLATNMISVGVDIDRLGLMAVMGQPQASAEYIQATSRVGRQHPGLVVTIFNSARSRDRSHYESFRPFHQALYRAVEATSATPFAARARDRGLRGVLIALARLLIPAMAPNTAAHLANDNWDGLTEIARLVTRRVDAVDADETEDTDRQILEWLDTWADAGEEREGMKYQNTKNLDAALMVRPEDALTNDEIDYFQPDVPWPTMQSLRDVDAESGLYQIPMRRKS